MKVDPEKETVISKHMSCPYLGLKDDRASLTAFPSRWNVCYRARPPEPPSISHQRHFCLLPAHQRCHIFKAEEGKKLPKSIKYHSKGLSAKTKKVLTIAGIALVTMVVFLGVIFRDRWFDGLVSMISLERQPTETPFIAATAKPTREFTATEDQEQATQPSPSPVTPTDTPTTIEPSPTTQDPILALDTPIGEEVQFIMHRVAEGESLQIFANEYNTSIEAIRAVNYNLIAPLWVNWIVIIPINITDVSELPTFEAYQVEEEIPIKTLAAELSVDFDDILFYNHIDSEHILHQGEWVLIPRE